METVVTHTGSDRRRCRRAGMGEHGILSARVRPGYFAAVIDISAGGALIEIARRLLPNSGIDLQIETVDGRVTLRGNVLRSVVARLRSNLVSYRAAIAFERECMWFVDRGWTVYPVPGAEAPGASPGGVDATREVV